MTGEATTTESAARLETIPGSSPRRCSILVVVLLGFVLVSGFSLAAVPKDTLRRTLPQNVVPLEDSATQAEDSLADCAPLDGKGEVLLVPGFTSFWVSLVGVTKSDYFPQKFNLDACGRRVRDMNVGRCARPDRDGVPNTPCINFLRSNANTCAQVGFGFYGPCIDAGGEQGIPGFDSTCRELDSNANAIVKILQEYREEDRKVVLLSHSKGGQDTLHALLNLYYEYARDSSANEPPWKTVAGWVSFTSNFFESEFEVNTGCGGGGIPTTCSPAAYNLFTGERRCNTPNFEPCADGNSRAYPAEEDCGSDYADFPIRDGEGRPGHERQVYMRSHREAIEKLMQCVPTVSAYGTYVPRAVNLDFPNSPLHSARNHGVSDNFNGGIWYDSAFRSPPSAACPWNDGLVPARAGQLPWAKVVKLENDRNMPTKCGVDHAAPAVDVNDANKRFWTPAWREQQTRKYIADVEAAVTIADAGPDQTLECESHQGVSVTFDGAGSGAGSPGFLRVIDMWDWSEDGQSVATGSNPTITLPAGVHDIRLLVTDSCGNTAEDHVSVNVEDPLPPDVSLEVDPASLWPPDHQMTLVATGVGATDICDANPELTVTVTSNEPVSGRGAGNTSPDWQVVENADGTVDVWVRAERSGRGGGRVYTIRASATDASGNSSATSATVSVGHDQGGHPDGRELREPFPTRRRRP